LSDRTKKENIVEISNALEVIRKLVGVEFDWIDNGKHSSGVIAQDIEPILPFLIEGDGIKTMNYNGLSGYFIEALKQLDYRLSLLGG
jgi:hypothetical protein